MKGMTGSELVFELHVRRGLELPKVARVLGVGVAEVREFWRQYHAQRMVRAPVPAPKSREELLAGAPRSEADFTGLRERVCLELWETVVATFAVPEMATEAEGDEAGAPMAKPAMLSVRMRALKQMGKLYGLDGKRRKSDPEAVPECCATPEEVVEMVREWRRSRGGS